LYFQFGTLYFVLGTLYKSNHLITRTNFFFYFSECQVLPHFCL
jgi:hypothetical protein